MSGLHSDLVGTDLHEVFHYVQSSDPGAVGAGKYWLDTTSTPYLIKRRNTGDTGWDDVGGSGGGGGGITTFASALRATNQTIPNNTQTAMSWSDVVTDNGPAAWFNLGTDATIATVPESGWYLVGAEIHWATDAGNSVRAVRIVINGTGISSEVRQDNVTGIMKQTISAFTQLSTNDTVSIQVFQDSGAGLDVAAEGPGIPGFANNNPNMWIMKISS